MKMAYLDEAGVGGEPWVVVAGAIIDPDIQWAALKQYLSDMADHYLRPEDREDCVFHATEIFSGTKRFHKDRYSLEKRCAILRELCKIPAMCGIRLVVGAFEIKRFTGQLDGPPKKRETKGAIVDAHCVAYAMCVCAINEFMKEQSGELAVLVVEDNADARRHLKSTYQLLRDEHSAIKWANDPIGPYLPITSIADVPHFVAKAESPIMQVADVCAFVFMRHLCGLPHVEEYFEMLQPNFYIPAGPSEGPTP